jgi:hypothetical protein
LVTPTTLESAIELTQKVFKAFASRDGYKIVIKYHPLAPFGRVSKHLNFEFPRHFEISNRSVPELLKESDVLLYTSSAASIEAIAAGVPAVHVGSELSIDLDPLDICPETRASARSVGGIVNRVEEAVGMGMKKLSRRVKAWSRAVKDLFGGVDDQFIACFAGNNTDLEPLNDVG